MEVPRDMSNHSTNPFGGGRKPDLRGLRSSRGGYSLCLVLGLVLFASSAMAAEIMEVRVGRHAEFTRVVFELDRAAGYRIERADPTSDVAELVVSLEAASIPRRIQSSKSLIVQVEVEPDGSRSVARIRLAKEGLRLKEMILASPPRIVLDVLSDEKKAAPPVARVEKPKAAPAPEAVPSFDEPTFEEIVAQNSQETAPVAEATPEPAPVVVAEPAPTPTPEPVAEMPEKQTPASEVVANLAEPSTSIPMEELTDEPMAEMDDTELAADIPAAIPPTPAMPESVLPEPAPTRTTRPMVVKSKPAKDEGGGWMTWALAGVGAIVLLLGGVVIARKRRGGRDEVDFLGDENTGGYADADKAQMGSEENPFGGLASDGPQMTLGGADDGGATSVSLPDEEKESESVVFGDSEENSMEDMEVISREQVNESLGGMPSAAGVPEEFQQMMREMNRRVESLEGRIDELVDARDRLERQVAAQTEELRVQRAAIARTQRAVRNLARPEDGDGEVEATEPALRDPNQPSTE
jgi:hypothetical protein